jgi:tetratricopeptide (TPR) repeat protein
MFDALPVRFWLLLLIAALGFEPLRYLYRHYTQASGTGDAPAYRRRALQQRQAAVLVLAAIAVFIFTPAAVAAGNALVTWPPLLWVLTGLFGGLILALVVKAVRTGRIQAPVEGARKPYHRRTQPNRFWLSAGFHTLVGSVLLGIGINGIRDAPLQPSRDLCANYDNVHPRVAIAACDEVLRQDDGFDRSGWYNNRGILKHKIGDYAGAVEDYTLALRDAPRSSSILYNRGLAFDKLDNFDLAVADYTNALAVWPGYARALESRGLLYLDTERYDKAIADFTRQQALDPRNPYPIANRGISHAWLGDRARAESDFARAQALDPTNVVVLRGRVVLSRDEDDPEKTIALLDDLLEKYPQDRWGLSKRANVLYLIGEDSRAAADAAALQRIKDAEKQKWVAKPPMAKPPG